MVGLRLSTTSQSASQTAPLVGEPLAKPFTLRGLPKPPLGRGGGTASAVTERLSPAAAHGQAPSSYNLSVSLRSTAPLVGEPLAKRRSFPLCQSLPSVGEVALRSNDGEVEPGRWHGVSRDGEVELLSQRESLCLRRLREFVENARQKREEFVKVIKMPRRY